MDEVGLLVEGRSEDAPAPAELAPAQAVSHERRRPEEMLRRNTQGLYAYRDDGRVRAQPFDAIDLAVLWVDAAR